MHNGGVSKNRYLQGIVIGIAFLLIGIGFIFIAVKSIQNYSYKQKNYKEINSKIIDYDVNEKNHLQAIIVEYKVNNITYKKISDIYTNIPDKINSKVKLKYNPNDPSDAIFKVENKIFLSPYVGVLFTIVGIIFIIIFIKKNKKVLANNVYNEPIIVLTKEIDNNSFDKPLVTEEPKPMISIIDETPPHQTMMKDLFIKEEDKPNTKVLHDENYYQELVPVKVPEINNEIDTHSNEPVIKLVYNITNNNDDRLSETQILRLPRLGEEKIL